LRPGEVDHEIVLEPRAMQSPPFRVSGRVLDEATQEPLRSFKVSLGEVSHSEFPPDYRSSVKGQNGEFRMNINTPCPFPSYVLLVEAEGYLPTKSQIQATKDGNKELNFVLKKGSGLAGVVKSADGRPAVNAMLYYCTLRDGVYMEKGGVVRRDATHARQLRTDEQGRFTLPVVADPHSLIVLHDDGFAEVKVEELTKSAQVTLSPWGHVEGQLLVGQKPAADETIVVQTMTYRYGDGMRSFAPLSLWLTTQTDADGKFVFDKVPPGERRLTRRLSFRKGKPGPIPETHGFPFIVQAGQTTRVTLGGTGRSVIGRVVAPGLDEPIDWQRDVHRMTLQLPDPSQRPRPKREDSADDTAFVDALKQYSARHKAFWISEEGRALERAQRTYVPVFAADGSFRADDLPAGTYELVLKPTGGDENSFGPTRLAGDGKPIGLLTNVFTIPEMPGGRSDEPLDLGVLTFKATKNLKIGQAAPLFEIKNVHGQPLRLADYRGRFVLLDFWATWCGPCVAELPQLKETYESFRSDDRFVMLGLSLDASTNAPMEFAQTNEVKWTQGFLGDWSKTSIPNDYGVEGIPSLFLIGPDGNIFAKDLRGSSVKSAVARALKK
jgi:peroxiredoxin